METNSSPLMQLLQGLQMHRPIDETKHTTRVSTGRMMTTKQKEKIRKKGKIAKHSRKVNRGR